MRNLFFKTTQPRHPSRLLRFVYAFLRLRHQAVFFVRPRSRNSLFFRLQILRKMFVWFYTNSFSRTKRFRRLITRRTLSFRSFLDFCTTLEMSLSVLLYRFHFVENMEAGFAAIKAGCVFKNGLCVTKALTPVRLGDYIELFFDDAFKTLSILHLIRCLPTLRVRLTLKDSIVNTDLFYAMFLQQYSLLAVFKFQSAKAFNSALLSIADWDKALLLNLYRFYSNSFVRLMSYRREGFATANRFAFCSFWWSTSNSRLLLEQSPRILDTTVLELNQPLPSDFAAYTRDVVTLSWLNN